MSIRTAGQVDGFGLNVPLALGILGVLIVGTALVGATVYNVARRNPVIWRL